MQLIQYHITISYPANQQYARRTQQNLFKTWRRIYRYSMIQQHWPSNIFIKHTTDFVNNNHKLDLITRVQNGWQYAWSELTVHPSGDGIGTAATRHMQSVDSTLCVCECACVHVYRDHTFDNDLPCRVVASCCAKHYCFKIWTCTCTNLNRSVSQNAGAQWGNLFILKSYLLRCLENPEHQPEAAGGLRSCVRRASLLCFSWDVWVSWELSV